LKNCWERESNGGGYLILITAVSDRKANSRITIQSRHERHNHTASETIFAATEVAIAHIAARNDVNSIAVCREKSNG